MQRERMEREVCDFFRDLSDDAIRLLIDKYDPEFDSEMQGDELVSGYYVMLREQGAEPVWAAGSACGKMARMSNSDGAFHEHARHRMEHMPAWQQKKYFAAAKAAGINIQGKYFMSGLGAPDNPDAWQADPDGVLEVCKRRNLTCEGQVNHQGYETAPKQVALADDLVDEMVRHECRQDESLNQKCRKDQAELTRLRGLVKEKYGRPKSKMQ